MIGLSGNLAAERFDIRLDGGAALVLRLLAPVGVDLTGYTTGLRLYAPITTFVSETAGVIALVSGRYQLTYTVPSATTASLPSNAHYLIYWQDSDSNKQGLLKGTLTFEAPSL